MEILNPLVYSLNAAGQTITIPFAQSIVNLENLNYSCLILKNSGTLSGNIAVTYSGTPSEGSKVVIYYNANFILGSNTITLLGKLLNQQEATSGFKLEAVWENAAWKTKIFIDESVLPNGYNGYKANAILAAGGTVTLYPRLDKKKQRFTGSAVVMLAGYTVTADTVTAIEGDEFWLDFDSTLDLNGQALTVMGNNITAPQALVGGFSVYTYYSGSVWYSQVILPPSSSTSGIFNQVNSIFVDAIYGLDGTGTALRQDLPFQTLAAARTAGVALTPTATNPVYFKARGYFTEGLILADNFIYDLSDCVIERIAGNTTATFDDNSAAVSCKILGYPTTIRSTAGTTSVGCINLQNSGSIVYAELGKMTSTVGNTLDYVIANSGGGKLKIVTPFSIASNVKGIYSLGGTTDIEIKGDMTCVAGCATVTAGLLTMNVTGDLLSTGTAVTNDVLGVKTTGSLRLNCRNITGTSTTTETFYSDSSGDTEINCKSMTSVYDTVSIDTGATGKIIINGNISSTSTTKVPIRMNATGATLIVNNALITGAGLATTTVPAVLCTIGTVNLINCKVLNPAHAIEQTAGTINLIGGQVKASGANENAVLVTAGTMSIKDLTLVTNGTGKSLYALGAVNVYNYGGCTATVAKDANVTLLVGTVGNNNFIVSTDVLGY